jgi:hypothetical protein
VQTHHGDADTGVLGFEGQHVVDDGAVDAGEVELLYAFGLGAGNDLGAVGGELLTVYVGVRVYNGYHGGAKVSENGGGGEKLDNFGSGATFYTKQKNLLI